MIPLKEPSYVSDHPLGAIAMSNTHAQVLASETIEGYLYTCSAIITTLQSRITLYYATENAFAGTLSSLPSFLFWCITHAVEQAFSQGAVKAKIARYFDPYTSIEFTNTGV